MPTVLYRAAAMDIVCLPLRQQAYISDRTAELQVFKSLLEVWIAAVQRFAWLAIIAVLSLTYVFYAYTADNLTINTNTTDMLSEELPFRQRYIEYKDAFPYDSDLITVVVEAATADRADIAALRLAARLRQASGVVEKVYDFAGEPFFRQNGLLYSDLEELESLADRLSQSQGLLGALNGDPSLRGLSEVLELALKENAKGTEPVGDLADVLRRIAVVVDARASGKRTELSWQALLSGDDVEPSDLKRFLQVRVKADWSSLSPAAPAMAALRTMAREEGLTPEQGVRVRLTGGLAMSTEELSSVFEGAKTASLLSLALVSLCLFFGLRSLTLVGGTILTLVCGLVWTAAFAALAVGHLNLLSVAFAVLFIGLGVDFGIHLALRFAEETSRDQDRDAALRRAALGVGGAMALCAVSAAIGFYSFLPTAYLGLAELGLISGTSMFIALFMSLTLLPALLSILPYRPRKTPSTPTGPETRPNFIRKYGGEVSALALVAAVTAISFVPFARFDFDPLNLQDPSTESVQTTLELIRESKTSPKKITVIRPDIAAAEGLAAQLTELKEVSEAVSIADFIPKRQAEKLEVIRDLEFVLFPVFDSAAKQEPVSAEAEIAALRRLEEALAGAGGGDAQIASAASHLRIALQRVLAGAATEPEVVASVRDGLLGLFSNRMNQLKTALQARKVGLEDIPKDLRLRYLSKSGIARVEVTPAFSVEENIALRRFIEAVQSIAPSATGSPVVILEASRAVVEAILQAAGTAAVLIVIMLLVLLRSLRDTLLVFYPLVLAALLTVATAVVIDLAFNFANVIVLPLLLGLGVASGIHLVMRARDANTGSALLGTSTPRAVTFSALTTILSFGSLAISSHRGTASMGVLLTIAIGFTLISSLIALPALMAWLESRSAKGAKET